MDGRVVARGVGRRADDRNAGRGTIVRSLGGLSRAPTKAHT